MPHHWRDQIWLSLEEGAGKRCSECAANRHSQTRCQISLQPNSQQAELVRLASSRDRLFSHLKRHLTRRQAALTDRPSPGSRVAAFATRTSAKCVVSLDPNTYTIKKDANLIWQYKYMTVPNKFYNTTLLSLGREIYLLARHLHKTISTFYNKTSTVFRDKPVFQSHITTAKR